MVKKMKKQIMDITTASLLGAGASVGLGAVGGNVAHQGQQGISNATSFLPITGSVYGTAALLRAIPKPKKKKGGWF